MSKHAFSVIIPAFNRVNFLPITLESILSQTLNDIEILICDDGSYDGTSDFLKKIQKKYSNISIIRNNTNMGAGVSRNKLIRLAKGELINFIDSDDWFHSCDVLENIYKLYVDNNCDIIVSHHLQVSSVERFKYGVPDIYKEKFYRQFKMSNAEEYPCLLQLYTFCNLTLRNAFVKENNIAFPEDTIWEDTPFLIESCIKAKSILINPNITHCVRRHDNSIMGNNFFSYQRRTALDLIEQVKSVERIREKIDLCESKETSLEIIRRCDSIIRKRILECEFLKRIRENPSDVENLTNSERLTALNALQILSAGINKMLCNQSIDMDKRESLSDSHCGTKEIISLLSNSKYSDKSFTCNIDKKDNCIFLHIGATKTGSTFIQQCLHDNREILKGNNVFFDEDGLTFGPHARSAISNKGAGHQYLAWYASQREMTSHIHRLKDALSKYNWSTCILSTELLSHPPFIRDVSIIGSLVVQQKTKVILYIRNPAEWIESEYKERVTNRWGREERSLSECLQAYLFSWSNMYDIIQKWSKVFGSKNIIIRSYELAKQNEYGIMGDFLESCELKQLCAEIQLPQKTPNVSFGRQYTELIRIFNQMSRHADREQRFEALQKLVSMLDMCIGDDQQSILSPADARGLTERWAAENKLLVEEGFLTPEAWDAILHGSNRAEQWEPFSNVDFRGLQIVSRIVEDYAFLRAPVPEQKVTGKNKLRFKNTSSYRRLKEVEQIVRKSAKRARVYKFLEKKTRQTTAP